MSKVLVVDDSPSMRAAVSHMLRGMNLQSVEADSGECAIELYLEERPSIVLLDVNMPGIDGYETARRIRAAEPDEWVPIIFLSANESDQDFTKAIESGGDDYLIKPVGRIVLAAKIRALQRLELMRRKLFEMSSELAASNRRLEQLSQSDGLTGVANRRYFDSFLAHHVALAARQKTNLSLVLCDVDCFKAYNDHYGHLAGDECLRWLGRCLQGALGEHGTLLARFGGEEFVAVVPDIDGDRLLALAEEVRLRICGEPVRYAGNSITLSASIGVYVVAPGDPVTADEALHRADDALYAAKDRGRNCVQPAAGLFSAS